MSSKYKFRNPEGAYLITMTVVDWVDVFTRDIYKDIVVESLNYCVKNKGFEIYAWVIMTNHVHLIAKSSEAKLEDILRDLKRHTAKAILAAIVDNMQESRKDWLLPMFYRQDDDIHLWQYGNHPLELATNEAINNAFDYVHDNPVRARLVDSPEHYVYSSAVDFAGGKGLVQLAYEK